MTSTAQAFAGFSKVPIIKAPTMASRGQVTESLYSELAFKNSEVKYHKQERRNVESQMVDGSNFVEQSLNILSREPSKFTFSHDVAQNQRVKSRSEVMSQVKRRYGAKILKISLDQARQVYVVRLLMPNGKVKTVRVNARG